MKKAFQSGSLAAALLAASGQAFQTTVKQQISTNFAQAEVQHHITIIDGELLPCRDSVLEELIVCPEGQFVWRTLGDGNINCPCRYALRECDNQFEEFDTLTGACVCVERLCPDNHFWDFNVCECRCDICRDCEPNSDGHAMMWDTQTCSCVCEPEVHPTEPDKYTWNIAECALECKIQECTGGNIWDQYLCDCKCAPTACQDGFEWYQDECTCKCTGHDQVCPRGQYFDSETCGCLCAPQECAEHYFFDTEICNCVCMEPSGEDACEDEFFWNTQTCKCECNPAVSACAPGEYLDIDDCICKCAPEDCAEGLIWNESICRCVCCPTHCPDNFYWNSEVCECQCSPIDCDENHYWNHDHCNCVCQFDTVCESDTSNYYFDAEECQCKCFEPVVPCEAGNIFDTDLCACVCIPADCDSGMAWSVVHCACVCQPEICPLTQYFRTDIDEPANCGCFCKPHFCAHGYHWDEEICNCVCSPPTGDYACPEGYYWDSVACKCRCIPLDCSEVVPYSLFDAENEICRCAEDPVNPCDALDYFDTITCSCLCRPNQECSEGHYWDTRICGCLPEHCHCPIGFYYSFETDDCECLNQICASGFEFNTHTCSCQHENIDCLDIDGVSYFFDPSSGECRCYAADTPAPEGQIWDMEQCAFVDCQECDEGYYFDEEFGECLCAFQAPYTEDGTLYTFDRVLCAFVCAPQKCFDDTYYWDNNQCKCACYRQECLQGYEWNHEACRCDCAGIPPHQKTDAFGNTYVIYECPCGFQWDELCCECRPCVDQGDCDRSEFYNPLKCQCECLPQCCDEFPGTTWNPDTCQCEVQCSSNQSCPGEQVKAAFPGCECGCPADSPVCVGGQFFNNVSCQCDCQVTCTEFEPDFDAETCTCSCGLSVAAGFDQATADANCQAVHSGTQTWVFDAFTCSCVSI